MEIWKYSNYLSKKFWCWMVFNILKVTYNARHSLPNEWYDETRYLYLNRLRNTQFSFWGRSKRLNIITHDMSLIFFSHNFLVSILLLFCVTILILFLFCFSVFLILRISSWFEQFCFLKHNEKVTPNEPYRSSEETCLRFRTTMFDFLHSFMVCTQSSDFWYTEYWNFKILNCQYV